VARIAEKLERRLRERGLAPALKPLPTSVGLVLVEAASREDDEDLRDLWANLLANHTDPNREVEVDKDVIEVIRQLTSVDARLMTFLGEHTWDIHGALAQADHSIDRARAGTVAHLRPHGKGSG
jgi:hypothetical protein